LKRAFGQQLQSRITNVPYHNIGYVSQARKIDPKTRAYDANKLVTSMVGIASSKDSQYVVIVFLDEALGKQESREIAFQTWYRITKAAFGAY
jgi:hypothetical protein